MKLDELKLQIDKLIEQGKGSMEIVVSSDAEGNDFNNIHEIDTLLCYDGEPIHPDDVKDGYYRMEDTTEKLVLWVY